jgi:hypothetical protein
VEVEKLLYASDNKKPEATKLTTLNEYDVMALARNPLRI